MIKKFIRFLIVSILAFAFFSCASLPKAMVAFTGETDKEVMAATFPVVMKGADALAATNPKDLKKATLSGSLAVMYANVFIQHEAEMLPVTENDLKHRQFDRAKMFYMRGRDKIMDAFDAKFKGFKAALLSSDESQWRPFLDKMKKNHVESIYWMCAGWLSAFSLDTLNPDVISTVPAAVAFMRKAADLNPDFNDGAIWDALTAAYAALPVDFGGNSDEAMMAHNEAMRASGGKSIGPYLTFVTAFCVPQNDSKGFDEWIEKALAIDPNANKATRFQTVVSREKALWLKAHKDDFIIDWGE